MFNYFQVALNTRYSERLGGRGRHSLVNSYWNWKSNSKKTNTCPDPRDLKLQLAYA